MNVGKKIDLYIREKGMSRRELAQKSGISEAAISRYINGTRQPKAVSLNAIAKALDVPISEFLGTKASIAEDVEGAIQLIARNAKDITTEQKKQIINVILGV